MKTLKLGVLYIGSFWYGYTITRKVLNSDDSISDILERLGSSGTRKGLSLEEMRHTVQSAAKRFIFHKSRRCLSTSFVLFHYMKCYGFRPAFVIEIDFESDRYYNCHCWVVDTDNPQELEFEGYELISRQKHIILLKKNENSKGTSQPTRPFQEHQGTLRSDSGPTQSQ